MNQASLRPEQVIRRFLETHEGPLEAHILHLKQTFEFDDLSPENLKRATDALEEVDIRVEPPLEEVAADGRLTLSIAERAAAPAEPESSRLERDAPKAEHEQRRPGQTRIRRRLLRRVSGNRAGGERRQPQPRGAEREEAATAARQAFAETPPDGDARASLEQALGVLGDAAAPPQETLAAIDYLVAQLRPKAERHLDEAEQALTGTAAAREQVDATLAGLDDGLGQLVERNESVRGEFMRQAERRSRLLVEWDEGFAAARDALGRVRAMREEREGIESRLAELTAATQQLSQTRQAGISEIARWEAELEQIPSRVAGARAAVQEAISDPDVHDQLETRVAALREAEATEDQTRRRLEHARDGLETGLAAAQAGFESAREGLRDALAGEGEEKAELWARFDAHCDAQREAFQALDDELSTLTAFPGDGPEVADLGAGLVELRGLLTPEGDEGVPSQATVEAAVQANRAALAVLRPIGELQRIRERAAAELADRLAEAEQRVVEVVAKSEQAEREAGMRLAESASELEARERELERARAEAEAVRERLEEVEAERAEAEAALAEAGTARAEADEARAEAEAARAEANKVRAEADQAGAAAEEARDELERVLSREEGAPRRIAELSNELAEADQLVVEVVAKSEQAEREAGMRLAESASELEARERELERARAEAEAVRERLEEVEAERAEAEVALAEAGSARAEADEAGAAAEAARAELGSVRAQAEEARAELERAPSQDEGAERRIAELAAQLDGSRSEFDRRLGQLAEEVARARSGAQELRARAERSERHVVDLKEELSSSRREAEKRLAQRDAELEQARSQAPDADLQRRVREAEEKLTATESEVERARADEKAAREQLIKLSKELEDARERLGHRRVERRQKGEDHLVEAIESVRRALTDDMEGGPPR
jgi:chromosome segregation ATPase